MSTVTIERVESHLAGEPIKIDAVAGRLGLRPTEIAVFRKIYGLDALHFDPDQDIHDLVLPAPRRLLAALDAATRASIRYVIYAHTMQTVAPPDVDLARQIRDRLGLFHAEAFALGQQACVSSLGAVDLAGKLLAAEGSPGQHALIVTGEQAYSSQIQLIPHSAIMAEAGAACLVSRDGAGDVVRAFVVHTHGGYAAGLLLDEDGIRGFGAAYPEALASVIRQAVDEAGLSLDDIALVIPHNVNAISWRQVIKTIGLPPERFFLDNIARTSHCYASDAFVNYTTLRDADRLAPGRHYVVASVGLGATFGAMVLTHGGTAS
ncbi:3-oxoacyl-[acyl-carrier-protein] synthase, KASIII [plant metagenome]|uniref:3-oxoacyl-[acyl-carrier-protein] synthase, KASIII n=1 Tax=plant metagenome TaxID=1297885 RepID=A0A484UXL8_9ZZZZ